MTAYSTKKAQILEAQRQAAEAWAEFVAMNRVRDAAHDLLEALKEARRWIGDGDLSDGMSREIWTPEYAAAVDMVDAAIAKATGEAA